MDQWKYVAVAIPSKDVPVTIKHAEFVVRAWNGTPIVAAEGIAETNARTGELTFVLSPESFGQLVDYWTRKMNEEVVDETEQDEKSEKPWYSGLVQAESDGNYTEPGKQTGSLYGGQDPNEIHGRR